MRTKAVITIEIEFDRREENEEYYDWEEELDEVLESSGFKLPRDINDKWRNLTIKTIYEEKK